MRTRDTRTLLLPCCAALGAQRAPAASGTAGAAQRVSGGRGDTSVPLPLRMLTASEDLPSV